MPSFDIVSEVNLQEVDNAVNQTAKEIGTRYDFKGSKCSIEHEGTTITIIADDEYKREQVVLVLKEKMVRRKVDTGVLDFAKPEQASGNLLRQVVTVKQGIDADLAKTICKMIKGSKLKVQASIQGDTVRVTGKKRDDLQEAIARVKEEKYELPLQFINFRD
ncbi:MAG: YajQ family cyclic di-GMP-binding protein [Magnetococcales bacterium]|nr:YajQ family cyclic di-GMP-binding protein [Magnetococcales bacterium]